MVLCFMRENPLSSTYLQSISVVSVEQRNTNEYEIFSTDDNIFTECNGKKQLQLHKIK